MDRIVLLHTLLDQISEISKYLDLSFVFQLHKQQNWANLNMRLRAYMKDDHVSHGLERCKALSLVCIGIFKIIV